MKSRRWRRSMERKRRRRKRKRKRRRRRRRTTTTYSATYNLVDASQGWIRHARGFYPRCLARAKTGCWGRIIVLLLFAVLYCTLHYIKLRNKRLENAYICCVHVKSFFLGGGGGGATLITSFCSIVLNLSHQCVRLCCSVCVLEGLCVMSEGKVCFFSKMKKFGGLSLGKFGELS